MKIVDVFGEIVEISGDLHTKFAGRTKYQCLRQRIVRVDLLDQWQSKGSGFACSGLGKCDNIRFFSEQERYNFFLYWHWYLKTKIHEGQHDLFADTQFFKCKHVLIIVCRREMQIRHI